MKIFATCCKNLHSVCNLGSRRYYIQSAYSLPNAEKIEQEVRPFRKIDDSFKKIIVTKDIVPAVYDENGVLTINIYDFLLDKRSLDTKDSILPIQHLFRRSMCE